MEESGSVCMSCADGSSIYTIAAELDTDLESDGALTLAC